MVRDLVREIDGSLVSWRQTTQHLLFRRKFLTTTHFAESLRPLTFQDKKRNTLFLAIIRRTQHNNHNKVLAGDLQSNRECPRGVRAWPMLWRSDWRIRNLLPLVDNPAGIRNLLPLVDNSAGIHNEVNFFLSERVSGIPWRKWRT